MGIEREKLNELLHSDKKKTPYRRTPKHLSREEQFYWKLQNDFAWYAEKFLKIRDKNSKLVDFRINEAQTIMENVDIYCRENGIMRRYLILKARQMGMSTYTEGKIFHETANFELVRSLILAHEEKASLNLFNMSKLYYEEIPDIIRPMKKYNNGKILAFENPETDESNKKINPGLRSNITIATAGTGEVGRSSTINKLHVSEAAFFPDATTTMLGLLQCVPDTLDSLVIIESTANGVGDWFHKQWQLAEKGENDFIPIFLPWFTDSNYQREFRNKTEKKAFAESIDITHFDSKGNKVHTYEWEIMKKFSLTYEQLNWRRWAIKNKCGGDEELFMQEYPSTPEEAFIATGRPRFNVQALKQYQTITKPPLTRGYLQETEEGGIMFVEDEKGYISIWDKPRIGEYYCIGADVAEGLAQGDYSCGLVGNPETFDIVAMWYGHIDPDLFGVELVKLARFYNEAYLGVEANNHGLTTLNSIKRLEYWNVFFQKSYDKIADKTTQKIGWTTSNRTKPLMIDKLAEFVREKWLGIYSDLIISEMFTYVIDDSGKTNAQAGCNDDTVMAAAIMLQLMLEGKGDSFVPEVQHDGVMRREHEIIDPLFESENEDEEQEEYDVEYSE